MTDDPSLARQLDNALRRVVEVSRPPEQGMGSSVPIATPRLYDIVRYMRNELLDEGLITIDEWTWLVAADDVQPASARRLETYDDMRMHILDLRSALAEARRKMRYMVDHGEWYTPEDTIERAEIMLKETDAYENRR